MNPNLPVIDGYEMSLNIKNLILKYKLENTIIISYH